MKKMIIALLSAACMMVFCSCGSPLDCSTCGMNYRLPGGYTMETDQKVANETLNEAMGVTEKDADEYLTAESYLAVQFYYGNEDSVSVTAIASPHNNSELKEAIEEYGGKYNEEDYTFTIDPDGSKGLHGVEKVDKITSNHNFYILHNGILYELIHYNNADLTEEEILEFIGSISFDNDALDRKTVECGDISLELHGEYQLIYDGDEEGYGDCQTFSRFGKSRTDLVVMYLTDDVEDVESIMELLRQQYPDGEYVKEDETFGTCHYLSMKSDDGYEVMSVFRNDDKMYMLNLINEDDPLTIKDLQNITKTIKVK